MKRRLFFKRIEYQGSIYLLILKIWIRHILLGREARWHRYFWDRLGKLLPEVKNISGEKCIWLQALSEGDIISLDNFLKKLKEVLPDYKIVFSTHNFGCIEVLKNFRTVDAVFYFPWDIKFICRRVIKLINPRVIILIEVARYPVFLNQSKSLGIPVVVLSGFCHRIDKEVISSADVEKRLSTSEMFKSIDFFGMQTELDMRNVISLGADETKVKVTGSLKMDLDYALLAEDEKQLLNEEFRISKENMVIIAGPAYKTENKLILEAYKDILSEFKNTVLIIAPRYIEELGQLEEEVDRAGLISIRRSECKKSSRDKKVIIIDNFGELPKLYGLATVVILGGSFSPPGGGHNVLEPAVHQKPIFFGPCMHYRVEFLKDLKEIWAGMQVKDKDELAKNIICLLNRPDKLKEIGFSSSKIIQDKDKLISENAEVVKKMTGER